MCPCAPCSGLVDLRYNKAKYADRLSPDGGYTLTVATGGDSATGKAYVEVDLETTAFKSTVARNNAPAK